jgi:hypothetical protein
VVVTLTAQCQVLPWCSASVVFIVVVTNLPVLSQWDLRHFDQGQLNLALLHSHWFVPLLPPHSWVELKCRDVQSPRLAFLHVHRLQSLQELKSLGMVAGLLNLR